MLRRCIIAIATLAALGIGAINASAAVYGVGDGYQSGWYESGYNTIEHRSMAGPAHGNYVPNLNGK